MQGCHHGGNVLWLTCSRLGVSCSVLGTLQAREGNLAQTTAEASEPSKSLRHAEEDTDRKWTPRIVPWGTPQQIAPEAELDRKMRGKLFVLMCTCVWNNCNITQS